MCEIWNRHVLQMCLESSLGRSSLAFPAPPTTEHQKATGADPTLRPVPIPFPVKQKRGRPHTTRLLPIFEPNPEGSCQSTRQASLIWNDRIHGQTVRTLNTVKVGTFVHY